MDTEAFLKNVPSIKSKFIELSKKNGALLFGEFRLNSGLMSNTFFNSGILADAESFDLMTDLLVAKLIEEKVEFDAFFGCPYKAIPIVPVLCLKYYKLTGKKVHFGYHRKEVKDHGEGKLLVGSPGAFEENSRLVVVDDICTTGKAVAGSVAVAETTKAKVVCILFLVNREPNYGGEFPMRTCAHKTSDFVKRLARPDIRVLEVMKLQELAGTSVTCW
nr:orotate phosphoribosyltransferase [Theileria orientalis]